VVEMDHHEGLHGGGGGGGGHAPPPEGDAFEAERQRLRTEDRSSFGGRPRSTVDMHDADAARSQVGASSLPTLFLWLFLLHPHRGRYPPTPTFDLLERLHPRPVVFSLVWVL
jgi:hypothetical protein